MLTTCIWHFRLTWLSKPNSIKIKYIFLVTAYKPGFISPLDNITVAAGRLAQFTCVVKHLGGHKVIMIKKNQARGQHYTQHHQPWLNLGRLATIRLEGNSGHPHAHGHEQPANERRAQWSQQLDSEAQRCAEEWLRNLHVPNKHGADDKSGQNGTILNGIECIRKRWHKYDKWLQIIFLAGARKCRTFIPDAAAMRAVTWLKFVSPASVDCLAGIIASSHSLHCFALGGVAMWGSSLIILL